jgi:hypothetical protein
MLEERKREMKFNKSKAGRLWKQGQECYRGGSGDSSKAAAFMWRAFQATHEPWDDGCAYCLEAYSSAVAIKTHHHLDVCNNVKKYMKLFHDESETALCRLIAASTLGNNHFPNALEELVAFC